MSSTQRPSSTTDSFKWLGQVCPGGTRGSAGTKAAQCVLCPPYSSIMGC